MIGDILLNLSPKNVAVGSILVLLSLLTVRWVNRELRIRQLGGHASRVKTWLPFGSFLSSLCTRMLALQGP